MKTKEEFENIMESGLTEDQRNSTLEIIDLFEELEAKTDDEMSEEDIDVIINSISDDDILDTYDDDELKVVDDVSGDDISEDVMSDDLLEALSRVERMRARVRFAKTKVKREIKAKIALKRRSNNQTFAKRARRAAINAMKVKIAKKPLNQLSVAEKERVERLVARRKKAIDRIALKLTPRVKQIERDRLTHRTTK